MFSSLLHTHGPLPNAAVKARRTHERWLTWAMTLRGRVWPVIPTRRVSEGGFSALVHTDAGRAWALRWWESALARLDEAP